MLVTNTLSDIYLRVDGASGGVSRDVDVDADPDYRGQLFLLGVTLGSFAVHFATISVQGHGLVTRSGAG
jgi:hypothetical protein